jgi:hypothetical protein
MVEVLRETSSDIGRIGLTGHERELLSARQWLGARDPFHAWQGRCALWYAYAYHGRESRLRTMVALSKRPVSMRRC